MKRPGGSALTFAATLALAVCCDAAAAQTNPATGLAQPAASAEAGFATIYDAKLEGHLTASGEPYRGEDLTAAHRSYPIGTQLRVTSRTGKSVSVRVNDRWNGGAGRIINLSGRAARDLGFGSSSTLAVRIDVEQLGSPRSVSRPAPKQAAPGAVASVVPFSASPPRQGSRKEECADQAKILGLDNEWAERHVRSCLANRPKK